MYEKPKFWNASIQVGGHKFLHLPDLTELALSETKGLRNLSGLTKTDVQVLISHQRSAFR